MPDEAENRLLQQAKSGNSDAFSTIRSALLPPLERFLWRMVGNRTTIDDLVQNTMLALYMNLDRMESMEHVRAFTFRVARNQTYDMLRREQHYTSIPIDDQRLRSSNQSPEEDTHWLLLYETVQNAMDALPELQRQALLMYHEGGLTYAEIAQALEVAEGTVKTRIFHARKNLIRLLPPDVLQVIIDNE